MRYSTSAILLIIIILIFSIFIANFANLISTDKILENKLRRTQNENVQERIIDKKLRFDDKEDHLLWFVQISDLHLSIFHDQDRIEQLRKFTNTTLDVIRPPIVLASGDLTDSKEKNHLGSGQIKEEWEVYKDILTKSNIANKTVWLDIRGNHDNFNVPHTNSSLNYFNTFSMQGPKHQRSYMHQIKDGDDIYTFIAVDACLDPGPKRQFNFIGLLDVNETSSIIDMATEARELGSNYIVWFGHYPTSCILAPGAGSGGFRKIIGSFEESFVYLCGHLHTMGGLLKNMYTFQKPGFLELELGDWKDNRLFRIAAFDHGIFSFVDVSHNDWPIVLFTNPKDALYHLPGKEDNQMILESTHVRVLIFSKEKVTNCKIQVDSQGWIDCKQVTKILYVAPWQPEIYSVGLHHIEASVETSSGNTKKVQIPFSLDGTRTNFKLLSRIVLMTDFSKIFQALFGIALISCILPLCIFRVMHELVCNGKCKKPRIRNRCFRNFIRKLWICSSVDRIFLPILFYCVYLTVGPWSMGQIIDGHTGVIFVWGIFVNNAFLPGSLSYLYGAFQLSFCQIPLNIYYAYAVDRHLRQLTSDRLEKPRWIRIILFHLPFFLMIIVELILLYFFWMSYGTIAVIFGPFRTWSLLLNISLWYLANNVPIKSLRSAISVWQEKEENNE